MSFDVIIPVYQRYRDMQTALILQQHNVNVVVNTLQKQFPCVCDDLPSFCSFQSSYQCFEEVGTSVVPEEDPKLHA